MKLKLICISIIFLFFLSIINVAVASPDNWVEVGRWSGEAFPKLAEFQTAPFTCNHVDWRIFWIYTATGSPFESILVIDAYEQGNPERIDLIYKSSYFSQSGTNNIRNNSGTFYLNATIANIEEYYIIVEQNVDSIPEFSPIFILPLFAVVTMFAIGIIKRVQKVQKQNSRTERINQRIVRVNRN